jgi:hypothetical protein
LRPSRARCPPASWIAGTGIFPEETELAVLRLGVGQGASLDTTEPVRRDNGRAIRATRRQLVLLCRELSETLVAIDGSKFKAVNTQYKNYTQCVIKRRVEQVEASISRYPDARATGTSGKGTWIVGSRALWAALDNAQSW